MDINFIGALANISSLVLWLPQARRTWKNRNKSEALKGISIVTQIIVIINTTLWCIYGILIHNIWLPLGTIITLPLAIATILIKMKNDKKIHEEIKELTPEKWFTFAAFRQLCDIDKIICLRMINTTDFREQIVPEQLHYESYEFMPDLDKMYWNKDLWEENFKNSEVN